MESENSHCHDDGEKEGPPLLELLDDDPSMLPIADFKEKVLDLVLNGAQQVLVLTSETGSGKTTQIPQYLADDKRIGGAGVVAVTQPRRVAATSVAKRVAEERGVKLGGEVGYRIRFDDCSSASTRIKYLTDGMLIREAMDDPELKQYSCVMLDEV
jgi:HrpA-like RNA helicase